MGEGASPYQSRLSVERVARGFGDGLLIFIEARGLPITDGQRSQIEGCQDLDQLEAWAKKAVEAPTVADILG